MSRELYFKLCQYFERYGKYYAKEHIEFVMQNIGACVAAQNGPDVIMQIMSALNLLRPDKNFYLAVTEVLKYYFDLNSNILEIGGGYYPALAKLIDEEQTRLGGGTITTYDPRLVIPSLGRINLCKKELNYESLDPYDLVVSLSPCKNTEFIIEKCNREKKPFFIALCTCPPYSVPNLELGSQIAKQWHEYLYFMAKSTLDEGARLEKMDTFGDYSDSPVFIKTYRNR